MSSICDFETKAQELLNSEPSKELQSNDHFWKRLKNPDNTQMCTGTNYFRICNPKITNFHDVESPNSLVNIEILSLQIIDAIRTLMWDYSEFLESVQISIGYHQSDDNGYDELGWCNIPKDATKNGSSYYTPIALFRLEDLFSKKVDQTDKKLRWIADTAWAKAINFVSSNTKFANLVDKMVVKSSDESSYDSDEIDSVNTYDHFIKGDIDLACIYLWFTIKC
jgi:hypothetical protein